jgi:predicted nucleotidyltransferase
MSVLFRSDTQGEILARVLLGPETGHTVAELARLASASYATAHREARRIVDAGLARERRVGRAKVLTAATDHPAYASTADLVRLAYGPEVVVADELGGIGGVEEAYIYGSWAARRSGEAGPWPRDVDVLLVGDPDRQAVLEAAERAERRLGREVDIRVVSAEAWRDGQDLFAATVKHRPLVRLELDAAAR